MGVDMNEERKKALSLALNQIERAHGKGGIGLWSLLHGNLSRFDPFGLALCYRRLCFGGLRLDHLVAAGEIAVRIGVGDQTARPPSIKGLGRSPR